MVQRFPTMCMVILLFVLVVSTGASAQESVNVSEERAWGIGMQVGVPYGGLVSIRAWFSPVFGTEGILFLNGSAYFVEGTLTARALFRISDADVVDFYVGAGGTLPLTESTLILSLLGGIEFGFRLAPALGWNIEFGASYALDGDFTMAIGTGLHYYFPVR